MWKNLPLKSSIIFSFGSNLLTILLILLTLGHIPPVVPLLYGLPSGVEQLVPKIYLLIAPVASILITAINIIIANLANDQFFKKTMIISSVFVSILTTITIIKIILLVGFF